MSVNDEVEKHSQEEYLDKLIKEFEREQTIQDVGLFLVDYPSYRLPHRLAEVLSLWLKKTTGRELAYVNPGHPVTELTDYFPLIDGMRVTGLSVYKACHLIAEKLERHEINPETLQKRYGEHRTPESRLIDDFAFGPARIDKPTGKDYSQIEKAFERMGLGPIDTSLEKRLGKLVDEFGLPEVTHALKNIPDQ